MAANLPFEYMGAVQVGSGACTLFCNVTRAATLLIFPTQPGAEDELEMATYSACLFFSISALILSSCLFVQICFMQNSPFYIYNFDWTKNPKENQIATDQE